MANKDQKLTRSLCLVHVVIGLLNVVWYLVHLPLVLGQLVRDLLHLVLGHSSPVLGIFCFVQGCSGFYTIAICNKDFDWLNTFVTFGLATLACSWAAYVMRILTG